MTQFSVHRARPQEVDGVWRILLEYYDAAEVVARDSKENVTAKYFGEGAGVWLATTEVDIIGCIALRRLDSVKNAGEVKRLYVQPAYRGQGIAAALYRSLEIHAAEVGYQFLYLDTAGGMTSAQRFYQSLGYENCSRYNDNPQATIFMRKKLPRFDSQI